MFPSLALPCFKSEIKLVTVSTGMKLQLYNQPMGQIADVNTIWDSTISFSFYTKNTSMNSGNNEFRLK